VLEATKVSYSWPFPFTAMDMPQKEVFENHNLRMTIGKAASHSCYRGVANLIQFDLWMEARLAARKK
jgi:hypothetical protein